MVMFKVLVKSLKNPFWIFQAFEIFTKEIFSKNSKKILSCHIWHIWWSCQVSCLREQDNIIKSPQNHFCPFWCLSNFTLPNISKWSQTLWTCSNALIIHLDQVAQVWEQVILIKVPQNPSCPEPNLNNSTLATFSFWSQLLWECSEPQMMTLHQVVHQWEVIFSTRSTQVHFC